jgi:hypothetical protein
LASVSAALTSSLPRNSESADNVAVELEHQARCGRLEIAGSLPQTTHTASLSMVNDLTRSLAAAAAIAG